MQQLAALIAFILAVLAYLAGALGGGDADGYPGPAPRPTAAYTKPAPIYTGPDAAPRPTRTPAP